MPLNSGALQSGILSVCSAPSSSAAGCADQWSQAMAAYATGIFPPSVTVGAARSALSGALAGAFASPAAAPLMETAFAAFAATVGAGQAGFVPVPPPRPVGFAALLAAPQPTHAAAAAAMTTLIDAWMRSGSSTPAIGGSPVPWT